MGKYPQQQRPQNRTGNGLPNQSPHSQAQIGQDHAENSGYKRRDKTDAGLKLEIQLTIEFRILNRRQGVYEKRHGINFDYAVQNWHIKESGN